MISSRQFVWILFFASFFGCKTIDVKDLTNTLVVRIPFEVEGLNPVFADSGSSFLYYKLIPTMINFNPKTLELEPLLLDSLPLKVSIDTGLYKGDIAYQFKIRDEAKWPNGQAILMTDYVFSLKVALNRKIIKNGWTRLLSFVKDVVVIDSRTCQVILETDRTNAAGYFAGFELLAEYHYDPKHLLRKFSIKDFNKSNFEKLASNNPEIAQFAKEFSEEKYNRLPQGVIGAGPYKLEKWVPNNKIILVKKKNYWADDLTVKLPMLSGNPDTLIYLLVEDEISVVSYIKNRQLDLVADLPADQFINLKNDSNVTNFYDFYTPKSNSFYMIGMNNRSPKLSKPVRQALAKSFDINELIKVATGGLGKKTIGPINDSSPYYLPSLAANEKDHIEAKAILKADGWADLDGDGILEKMINGRIIKLSIDFLSASSIAISGAISPILKKEGAKIGIQINIVNDGWGSITQKLKNRDFEMVLYRLSSPPNEYQPYGSWHSDNTGKNGRNYTGYSSAKVDSIINALQNTDAISEKKELYADFQRQLHTDQPAIFLFYPVKTVILNNKWKPLLSALHPGYFENAFELKNE